MAYGDPLENMVQEVLVDDDHLGLVKEMGQLGKVKPGGSGHDGGVGLGLNCR